MTIAKSENEEGTVTNRKGTRVWVTSLSGKKEKMGQLNKNPRHENCSQNQVTIPL